MKIYLIRHGRQSSSLCNVNVDLSDEGKRQAELLGKRMESYGIDNLYSSDLIRAVETAKIMNQYLKVEHKISPNIREISFGIFEGKEDKYLKETYSEFYIEQKKLEEDIPYPEGENGMDVYNRAKHTMDEIIQSDSEAVAIVTHGTVIRAILTMALGMDMSKKLLFARTLENTGITELEYDKEYKRFYLERFNDSGHMEVEPELFRKGWIS